MPKFLDRRHEKVGRLSVIAEAPHKTGKGRSWLCRCDCGNECVVANGNLKITGTRSCGCLQRERAAQQGKATLIDRVGEKFGRLTVLSLSNERTAKVHWVCECECGHKTTVAANALGVKTNSCGCLQSEITADANTDRAKHGHAARGKSGKVSREYKSWSSMFQRCHNPKAPNYHLYGGRGITICERWRGESGFEHFLADMGPRPADCTLDRKDTNGNYEPNNCRWSTASEQAKNRRKTPEYTARMKANLDAGRARTWNEPELRAKLLQSRKGYGHEPH
jgi:hypothetical protein